MLLATWPKGFGTGLGHDISLRSALDAAEPEIASSIAGHPLAEAALRETLGVSYSWLAEHAKAARQFERVLDLRRQVLGSDHYLSISSMLNFASALAADNRRKEALPLAEEALSKARSTFGPQDPRIA